MTGVQTCALPIYGNNKKILIKSNNEARQCNCKSEWRLFKRFTITLAGFIVWFYQYFFIVPISSTYIIIPCPVYKRYIKIIEFFSSCFILKIEDLKSHNWLANERSTIVWYIPIYFCPKLNLCLTIEFYCFFFTELLAW